MLHNTGNINIVKVGVLTISDSRTIDSDASGKSVVSILKEDGYEVSFYEVVSDDIAKIIDRLNTALKDNELDLILTVGGTGFGPRDNTPEATLKVVEKVIPGLPECMRTEGAKKAKEAYLSRGVAGIKGQTIIVNLPGSPKGARESLEAIAGLIPHSISMIKGKGH
ncbi:MAG: MogA/MoaB family molybdenum cofactor biosynthesis protein [Candidatus Omnitrophica bacterium]|nr:MogA/MoaB family molybdenum cofactor biosynthesis protein [Candidatus Omnitrophota bacterium]MBU1995561.1 MogA/MoaB family molybdenum cofactor biosynthesis protein [Candidatus Omnitrophota bacterium]MBU4333568.1 MogA/MoaB family molybdenum cofactor biosynthesis protein [Candidatus Omnitrophota bacterium]